MKKQRMGRPPKPEDEQASEIIAIRMTEAERELCEQAADRAELKLSAWIRDRATKAAKRESKRD
jgi:uncharacterized protein (DUF1778 family)